MDTARNPDCAKPTSEEATVTQISSKETFGRIASGFAAVLRAIGPGTGVNGAGVATAADGRGVRTTAAALVAAFSGDGRLRPICVTRRPTATGSVCGSQVIGLAPVCCVAAERLAPCADRGWPGFGDGEPLTDGPAVSGEAESAEAIAHPVTSAEPTPNAMARPTT